MFVHETGELGNPRWIINFPTMRHWKGKSRIEDIQAGLAALVAEVCSRNICSIAMPALGCGLGGRLLPRLFAGPDLARDWLRSSRPEMLGGKPRST